MYKHTKAYQKERMEVYSKEIPKAEEEQEHLGDRWLHSFMFPYAGNLKRDLRHFGDFGERVPNSSVFVSDKLATLLSYVVACNN